MKQFFDRAIPFFQGVFLGIIAIMAYRYVSTLIGV